MQRNCILIDCFDSYTYNVRDCLLRIGFDVDIVNFNNINNFNFEKYNTIVFSPGPKTPDNYLEIFDIIEKYKNDKTLVGICLGHQIIAQKFGGNFCRASNTIHGVPEEINIIENKFKEFVNKNSFKAMMYNSLVVKDIDSTELEILAINKHKEPMILKHRKYKIVSCQFHPESIGTLEGENILNKMIKFAEFNI